MNIINLGGEGEVPGALNQQPPGALTPSWLALSGRTVAGLAAAGVPFLICPNTALAVPDDSVDQVVTNNVPVDKASVLGPGVQSSEIRRILKAGGVWIRDGVPYYVKP